ncbi:CYTH domain-containing protein [Thalassobacillus pellis]|uniref:CYTH domain-containing protein n=1 Tax=Thalassobacillus pellis TaxID=748008 RepID=UPI00195FB2E9|nr:CYTH domain-containing protein [Thalassobacillus pellis]MBM7554017.1 uncharacterized protein YjbK [Thalassobacillus pellis]
MTQEIEIEFKNLLTEDEFHRLETTLPFDRAKTETQTNHYFETPEFALRDRGSALRIREKNGVYTMTLKQPKGEDLLETHEPVTPDEFQGWINGSPARKEYMEKQLNELGIEPDRLRYWGALTTRRNEIIYHDTTVVLDHSSYNDVEDYELELEADHRAHGEKIFHQLLTDHEIPERPTDNKIKRFFQTLR